MGEVQNKYGVLVRKSEGKRPLGKPRLWWDLEETATACGRLLSSGLRIGISGGFL
jgi:hypothetical protein